MGPFYSKTGKNKIEGGVSPKTQFGFSSIGQGKKMSDVTRSRVTQWAATAATSDI